VELHQAGRTVGAEGWKATARNPAARQVNPGETRVEAMLRKVA